MSPVGIIIKSHGVRYHQYADDTQLHIALRTANTAVGLSMLADCTMDVKHWYLLHGLQLNADKYEVMFVTAFREPLLVCDPVVQLSCASDSSHPGSAQSKHGAKASLLSHTIATRFSMVPQSRWCRTCSACRTTLPVLFPRQINDVMPDCCCDNFIGCPSKVDCVSKSHY